MTDQQLAAIAAWKSKYQNKTNSDFENKDCDFKYNDPAAAWYVQHITGINPVENPNPFKDVPYDGSADEEYMKLFGIKSMFFDLTDYPVDPNKASAMINYFLEQFSKNINVAIQYAYVPSGYINGISNYQYPKFIAEQGYLMSLGTDPMSSAYVPDYYKVFWSKLQPNQVVAFVPVDSSKSDTSTYIENIENHPNEGYMNVSGRVVISITTYDSVGKDTLRKTTQYYDLIKNQYSKLYFEGVPYGTKEYVELYDYNNYHKKWGIRFIQAK